MADKFLYPQTKKYDVHENRSLSNGSVITFNVPSYGTIDDIILSFTNSGAIATAANVKSSIGKIALNINGEQVINCTVERLYDFYKMLGNEVYQGTQTGAISLNLGRLLFKLPSNEDFFAWGCNNINTIQVQVYCGTLSSVTDCELSTVRRSVTSNLGSYIKLISYPQAMAAAGISTVDTLPRDANEGYLTIMAAAGTGGVISQGECIVNGTNIFQPMTQAVNDYVVNNYGLSAVSGYFNYCFADGAIKGVLPMMGVTELRLKTTFTTAPTSGVYDLLACSIRNIPDSMMNAIRVDAE
jgi:hypothetical protein